MKISQQGLELIKKYEQGPEGGPALESYLCPAGVWTIGWGHTKGVSFGQHATEDQCAQFLRDDVAKSEGAVNQLVSVPLKQHQFDALTSFVFNIGRGRRRGHPKGPSGFHGSTLLSKLNAADYAGAAEEFLRWNKSNGVVLKGLTARRQDEKILFLTGSY